MKNNKAMTYVLVVLVVGIWGYVIYRVLAGVSDTDVQPSRHTIKSNVDENLAYYRGNDSLAYDTLYHSPFLMVASMQTTDIEAASTTDDQPLTEEYDPIVFAPAMDILYLGYIENENHRNRVAIVQINGKQYYLRPKQQKEGITLQSIGASEIKVKTEYQTLTIGKQ